MSMAPPPTSLHVGNRVGQEQIRRLLSSGIAFLFNIRPQGSSTDLFQAKAKDPRVVLARRVLGLPQQLELSDVQKNLNLCLDDTTAL